MHDGAAIGAAAAYAPIGDVHAVFAGRSVLILIVGHLASAPRAQKEAAALRRAGARVHVRGNWHTTALADEDVELARRLDIDFAASTDLRRDGRGRIGDRLRQRLSREAYARFGLATSRLHGHGAPEQLRTAERMRADLTMVHSEPGLWIAQHLLARGQRVGVDFEDWFSHDLLPEDRDERVRAELRGWERVLLREAHACLATTQAMADALARDAGTDRVPRVVPNCFPALAKAAGGGSLDEVTPGFVAFYWVSQTIGPGRGLDVLAPALERLQGEWQLTLRGAIHDHRDWFERTFSPALRERVRCVPPVPNAALAERARSHDVGLALEIPYCANKDLTASNKIFEYLRAGLAVIATATRGQQEVLDASPSAGRLVPAGDTVALAAAMQAYIDDRAALAHARRAAHAAGSTTWDWARHEPVLLGALAGALERRA